MADAVKAGAHSAEAGRGCVIGPVNSGPSQAASYAVKSVSAPPLTGGQTGAGAWGASRPASASFSKVKAR